MAGDALRALAALAVLVYHAGLGALANTGGRTGEGRFGRVFGEQGGYVLFHLDLGLYIFFVLSGYLLARPWISALVDGRATPQVGAYLRNRALRIVPAFWVVTLATLIYYGPRGSSLREILAVPLFLQNYDESGLSQVIGQAWTLDVEMGFYVLLPLAGIGLATMLGRTTHAGARTAWIAAAIAAVFTASVLIRELEPDRLQFLRSVPAMLFAFMPGVALAFIETRIAGERARRRAAVAALAVLPCALIAVRLAGWRSGGALWSAVLAGAIVAAPLAWQWSGRQTWRALDNPIMRWLGERSYGIYLLHNGIQITLLQHLVAPDRGPRELAALALVASVPLTLAAAALLYRFVEQPALSWRARGSAATGHAGDPAPAR